MSIFYSKVKLHSFQHAFSQTHGTLCFDQDGWYSASRDAARWSAQRANGGRQHGNLPHGWWWWWWIINICIYIYSIYVVTSLKTNMTMENPLIFYRKFIFSDVLGCHVIVFQVATDFWDSILNLYFWNILATVIKKLLFFFFVCCC